MSTPIDRLRAMDPARGIGPQPDERGESDLRLLLAEPAGKAAPAPAGRRRLAPILVTAVVAAVLLALTVAVLGAVRPRVDVGGSPAPTTNPGGCQPTEVLPFQCGTYESTYGGKAVTGDLGGPAKDRLRLSFTQQDGALLLEARTTHCFAERILVRFNGKRLIRIGAPQYSQNGCFGRGADTRSWAYAFLNGPLETTDGETYSLSSRDSSVFFQYLGAAPIGAPQLPLNDTTCVAAHVAPFSCSRYRSSSGTGSLSFLRTTPYTLSFIHLNGQLNAWLSGGCNGAAATVQVDGDTVVAQPGFTTGMLCLNDRGTHDHALSTFFRGVLRYRIDGDAITFTKGATSATFTR